MIEMKYYTKEIKQKAEIMKKKDYRHHAIAVLLFIVGMFVSVSLTAHGKDINPQQAAKIAKKYVTLSRNSDTKVQTRGIQGVALLLSLATTRWVKYWPIAPRERLIR